MAYIVGIVLGLATCGLAVVVGLDRDRAFYPTVLIVVASYYVLFAVMGGEENALIAESVAMLVFVAAGLVGFKLSPWILVAGLAGHGVFDSIHSGLIANPGVPSFWPAFCLSYDVAVAGMLAVLIVRRQKNSLAVSPVD